MDVYPTHRTELVKNHAANLQIELLFVPAGGTSKYQPLDARVFGELKSRARAAFLRHSSIIGLRGATYEERIDILEDCWNRISPESIMKAWGIIGYEE
jgi:hypothetical protein